MANQGHGKGFDIFLNGNYRVCDANWDDLRISIGGTFSVGGGNDPTIINYPSTIPLPEYGIGDELGFTQQIPHNYKVGTNIGLHLHWTPHARGVAENGKDVGWRIAYVVANIDGTFGAETVADLTDACDGTDHKHQMTPVVAIDGSSFTISAMIIGRVYRVDTGANDWVTNTNGNKPALLEVDFHYQIDSAGSDAATTKSF